MRLFKLFKKKKISCGGEGCIEVKYSTSLLTSGLVFYRRPTYEEVLQFEDEYTSFLQDEQELRAIAEDKKESHAMVARRLFLPYAKKIFLRSEGFVDENEKPIDNYSIERQFDYLQKYRGYILVEMTSKAFEVDVTSKKKL